MSTSKKEKAIKQLEEIYEVTLESDFGSAFADTPEESLEEAGRVTLRLTIDLLKASQLEEHSTKKG